MISIFRSLSLLLIIKDIKIYKVFFMSFLWCSWHCSWQIWIRLQLRYLNLYGFTKSKKYNEMKKRELLLWATHWHNTIPKRSQNRNDKINRAHTTRSLLFSTNFRTAKRNEKDDEKKNPLVNKTKHKHNFLFQFDDGSAPATDSMEWRWWQRTNKANDRLAMATPPSIVKVKAKYRAVEKNDFSSFCVLPKQQMNIDPSMCTNYWHTHKHTRSLTMADRT